MGSTSLRDMIQHTDRRTALRWHFTANHYPPYVEPALSLLIELADKAIAATLEESEEQEIALPDGLTFRGRKVLEAWEIIETLHLEGALDEEDSGD